MAKIEPLSPGEHEALARLRQARRKTRKLAPPPKAESLGESASDWITAQVGSWRFIIVQSTILVAWIAANVLGWIGAWDPYPFILLNLVLSFQAAYTAPIIMMSQNRIGEMDRAHAEDDYQINLKAELEIEMLHQKIDLMREQEIQRLITLVESLEKRLAKA